MYKLLRCALETIRKFTCSQHNASCFCSCVSNVLMVIAVLMVLNKPPRLYQSVYVSEVPTLPPQTYYEFQNSIARWCNHSEDNVQRISKHHLTSEIPTQLKHRIVQRLLFQRDVAALGESVAHFDWPSRVTRVTLTWYPVNTAHAIKREQSNWKWWSWSRC